MSIRGGGRAVFRGGARGCFASGRRLSGETLSRGGV